MLKKAQEELRDKSIKEIEELKKEQARLVVEKEQFWDHKVQFENIISEVCQRVSKVVVDEDAESKVQQLGTVIAQLERDINILNALVYPNTLPKQIAMEYHRRGGGITTR